LCATAGRLMPPPDRWGSTHRGKARFADRRGEMAQELNPIVGQAREVFRQRLLLQIGELGGVDDGSTDEVVDVLFLPTCFVYSDIGAGTKLRMVD